MDKVLLILRKNQKGQAVLEYVLLILMIFIIGLAIMIGISRSTQIFFNNYYGEYFSCLLETGELPALGSDGIPETECDDLFQPFTVTDGRSPLDNSLDGGGTSGSTDGSTGNDENQNSSTNTSDSSGTASGGSDGYAGGAEYGSGGGSFGFGSGRSRQVPLSSADRGRSGSDDDDLGAPSGFNNFRQDGGLDDSSGGRTPYVPIYGYRADLEEEEEGKPPLIKVESAQNPEQALRGKRVPANTEKKEKEEFKSDEELGLPDFLRMIIMAAIILVIIVFFGGQVLQFQKSKD